MYREDRFDSVCPLTFITGVIAFDKFAADIVVVATRGILDNTLPEKLITGAEDVRFDKFIVGAVTVPFTSSADVGILPIPTADVAAALEYVIRTSSCVPRIKT